MPLHAREREYLLLGIEPPLTACDNHDNIGNMWRHHDNLSTFSQLVLTMIHIATDSCLLSCRLHGCNYHSVIGYIISAIGYIIKHHQCNFCYHMHNYFMLLPTMAFLYDGASTITMCERARKSVYFIRKTKMVDGHFLVFRRALLGWSVFSLVASSRTLYGRGSNALWRFCGDLFARKRGYRAQPFSTPLYIQCKLQ